MKSSTFANNWGREKNHISLVVENRTEDLKVRSNPLGIRWYFFIPMVVMTWALLIPMVRDFFLRVGWRWVHVMLLSFGISFSLNPMFAQIAFKLNMLDRPNLRKLHQEATPLLGGAAVFSGFLAALLINGIFSVELGAILIASLILFMIGVLDDYKEISAGIKLLAQLICTLFLVNFGIVLRVIPSDLGLFAQIGNPFLTIIWVVGITNAMNLKRLIISKIMNTVTYSLFRFS